VRLRDKIGVEAASRRPAAARALNPDQRLWPFRARDALAASAAAMLVLLGLMAALKTKLRWPGDNAETSVLLAVMVVSLVPILLAVADIVIEGGGAIEYRGVKVDFSKSTGSHVTGFTIPPNIGVAGQPLFDSNSAEILATLRDATRSTLAIVDLAGGEAWWETRLLVLLEGADRLGSPERIVFVATDH
jgi:hypothetical protein